jgi:hypothetical protein
MRKEQSMVVFDLHQAVDDLLRSFGVLSTFRAVLVVAMRRRQPRTDISDLSDHMRRDIGLRTSGEAPRIRPLPPWAPRF